MPLPPRPLPRRQFAVGLPRDFLELAPLKGRQGLAGGALFRIGEGAAVFGDPFGQGIEEFALPLRQVDALGLGRPAGLLQGAQGGALRGLALGRAQLLQRRPFRAVRL